ncbi:MAG: tyrosine-type recombinase/integrase [Acidimicrobiales bacterium]
MLFPGTDGGFANRRTFQRIWARAARDAGWPMKRKTAAVWHPHDLRHVAACWMLFDVRLDPAVVATVLGHANAAFTLSRYVGVRGDLSTTVTAATEGW